MLQCKIWTQLITWSQTIALVGKLKGVVQGRKAEKRHISFIRRVRYIFNSISVTNWRVVNQCSRILYQYFPVLDLRKQRSTTRITRISDIERNVFYQIATKRICCTRVGTVGTHEPEVCRTKVFLSSKTSMRQNRNTFLTQFTWYNSCFVMICLITAIERYSWLKK